MLCAEVKLENGSPRYNTGMVPGPLSIWKEVSSFVGDVRHQGCHLQLRSLASLIYPSQLAFLWILLEIAQIFFQFPS